MLSNFREVFLPDRGHIHHRLLEAGLSQRRAVIVLYGVGTLFALSAFLMVFLQSVWIASILLSVLGTLLVTAYLALYSRIRKLSAQREVSGTEPAKKRVESFSPVSRRQTQAR